jgi:hypothetical protein
MACGISLNEISINLFLKFYAAKELNEEMLIPITTDNQ